MEELINNFNIIENYSNKIDKERNIKKNNSLATNNSELSNKVLPYTPITRISDEESDEGLRVRLENKINEYDSRREVKFNSIIDIIEYYNMYYAKSSENNYINNILAHRKSTNYDGYEYDLCIDFKNMDKDVVITLSSKIINRNDCSEICKIIHKKFICEQDLKINNNKSKDLYDKNNKYNYMNNIEITDYWNTFYRKSGLNNGICSISAFESDRVNGFDLKIIFHNGKNLMVSIPDDSFSVKFVCKEIASIANIIYGTCCGGLE